MADFLSMLAGGQGSNSSFLGMTPDQQAAFDAMKQKSATQAILPALMALGLGYLSRPRGKWYGGQRGAILSGLRDASQTYQNEYQTDVNQQLTVAQLAQKQQRQNILDAATISNAQSNSQRAANATQQTDIKLAEDKPVGNDWAASYRNDPRFKNVLFPPEDQTPGFTQKQITDFWAKQAPREQATVQRIVIEQQNADTRKEQGDTRNAIGQQNADTASRNADTNAGKLSIEQQKWKEKLWQVSPVGSTTDPIIGRFDKLRSTLPPSVASTMPAPEQIAAMPRNQAEAIYKLYIGDAGKQTAKQVQSQQLNNRLKLNKLYKDQNPLDLTPAPEKLIAFYQTNGYDQYGNYLGTASSSPAVAATSTAPPPATPATPAATPTPAPPTAAPAATPTQAQTPAAKSSPTISLPGNITTTSAAINYLTTNYGMTRADAIKWIQANN